MINELLKIIEKRELPVYLQGTLTEQKANETPSYFTYWNYSTPDTAYYCNKPTRSTWSCWVFLYTTDDPFKAQDTIDALIADLRAAGWTVEGRGDSMSSSLPSHIARRITVHKSENY